MIAETYLEAWMRGCSAASPGFYNFGPRFYDPQMGRFITQDSYMGRLIDPLSLNRYIYVEDNPERYVDPTGHMPFQGEIDYVIPPSHPGITFSSDPAGIEKGGEASTALAAGVYPSVKINTKVPPKVAEGATLMGVGTLEVLGGYAEMGPGFATFFVSSAASALGLEDPEFAWAEESLATGHVFSGAVAVLQGYVDQWNGGVEAGQATRDWVWGSR